MRHSKPPAKLAMVVVLPLLLLCYGVGNVHCSTVHENSEDFQSLLEFKKGILDHNGALNNWNTNTHFCRWYGVNCTSTRRPLRVTQLNLSGKNLGGNISSSLGNLAFLEKLDLSNNSFYGPIPDALTNCSNLAYLLLSGNHLTGVIPPTVGFLTSLKRVFLDNNYLTGGIPAALRNITNLQILSFTQNQLTGSIPHEVMQMPNILELHLNQNNLSGGIPEVWQMPNIELLDLSQNYLTGRLPQDLSNVSSLGGLSLTSNMLGNTLPSNIGYALPNLTVLLLASNNFEGPIPASLGKPAGLETIDISDNRLTGQIPNSLGNLTVLSYLNLEKNMLQATDNEGWEFLHTLGNCRSLSAFSLSRNNLQGTIPNSIGNLSISLTRLLMSKNNLSGIVPPSIGKLSSLVQLSLDHNNLTGTIKEWVGNMTKLELLKLQSNSFIGTIPPSIGRLTRLTNFFLAENQFTGSVPPNLGNLKLLSELHLSYNNFQGGIPVELGNLGQLTTLNISSNKFGGGIPETLGKFEHIQTIQLDQNILTGNIPSSFSNLYTLSILNISHNNLSGPLPAFLNDLKTITKLDISYNNFQGQVPTNGVFANATIISLDDNPGLCGGATDLHLRPCHVMNKKGRAVNYLIKILIPIIGFMSLVLLVYFVLLERKRSRAYMSSEQSFGEHFEKVTFSDLTQATRDFSESNLIGRGSYGSVYRGKLKESKMEVAVKVFDLEMRGAERSFVAECEALRSIQHRNLLPIITACSTVDNTGNVFKALIYELMPNGSLDTWLHHKGDEEAPKRLSLTQRISIAVNIADALDYLHHDCGRPTVHCDLKPSNILLDDDMNALLGDFGIARFFADPQSTWAGSISSIGVKGTIGYIPPEYGSGGHVSMSGDVYSFGIVLLEILIGKRPTDAMFMDGLDIISFVENSFQSQIFDVIDVHLVEECKNLTQDKNVPEKEINKCLLDLVQVALSCTRSLPSERSNMKQIASEMHSIKVSQLGWMTCKK
ncbi:unnamed protein product [Miscanthus lutarioriparius]|uniref:Receptor kinase-like protein Xa21 n=1 Tax=Miscanthus lutarioriparius TaxID=422564 RepID=A0A811Q322_9POAL|nr:unnamed protein product [Miscanthus lutarioriparius]